MRPTLVSLAAGLALAGALVRPAAAQGFGLYEHSACAMARAGAAVASPCADGSAMFFNPAGLAGQAGVASIGGVFIAPRGGFTDARTGLRDDLKDKIYTAPAVYIAKPLNSSVTAGIGVFAPYGLATDWDTTAQGRYLGYHSNIKGIYIQPTIAAKLSDRVSIGVGFDYSITKLELNQRVDLSQQLVPSAAVPPGTRFFNLGIPTGTDFADIELDADDKSMGYHIGLLVKATDELSFGARYLSRQRFEFNDATVKVRSIATGLTLPAGNPFGLPGGTPVDALVASQFAAGGALTDQGGKTVLRFPEQAVVGLAYQASEKAKLLFDLQYTNWRVFDEVPLDFEKLPDRSLVENYHETYAYRFGGEYALSPSATGRLGLLMHNGGSPPETVTPNLPEGNRFEVTAGLGGKIGGAKIDVAYQYIQQGDRQGRITDGGLARPTVALNSGLFQFHAHLLSASLSFGL